MCNFFRPRDEEEARTPLCPQFSSSEENQEAGEILDSTGASRGRYLATMLSVFTEGLLPAISLFFAVYNIVELFFTNVFLGWVNLAIFCFPSILVLLYYVENMLHREKKLMEVGLIIALGPLLRWLCSVRLLLARHVNNEVSLGFQDLEAFATATRVIDGVFQGSLQIVWLLYLIATGIYPFPVLDWKTKVVHDWYGNKMLFPVLSSIGLYPSLAVLVKNLFQYWSQHHLRATTDDGSTTVLVEEDATRLYSIKPQQWGLGFDLLLI